MNEHGVSWQLVDEIGSLRCGPLEARVVFAALGPRLYAHSWHGHAIPEVNRGPFLYVKFGESYERAANVVEQYIRGADLVSLFDKTPPDSVAPAIYWRANFDPKRSAARVELIVSTHTDVLDSRPQIGVASYAGPSQWFYATQLDCSAWQELHETKRELTRDGKFDVCVCLTRDALTGMSFAQMVYPSDFVWLRVNAASSSGMVESRLFPEHLEKGVIRRGRICGWFMPAENDLETAVELAREFVNEPPPLTA